MTIMTKASDYGSVNMRNQSEKDFNLTYRPYGYLLQVLQIGCEKGKVSLGRDSY